MQGELNQARDALQQERENTLTKTDLTALSYATAQPGEIEELNEQKAHLEQVLRDIANCVIADTELSVAIPETEVLRSDGTRSPARSQSPSRRSRRLRSPGRAVSPTFANSTFDAVAGSLQKRQLQVQELRAKLEASQDAGTNLRKQLAETENQVAELETQIALTNQKLDETINEKDDAKREIDRNQASAKTVQDEKDGLSRTRKSLQQQVDLQNQDIERLRGKLSTLQQQKGNFNYFTFIILNSYFR